MFITVEERAILTGVICTCCLAFPTLDLDGKKLFRLGFMDLSETLHEPHSRSGSSMVKSGRISSWRRSSHGCASGRVKPPETLVGDGQRRILDALLLNTCREVLSCKV